LVDIGSVDSYIAAAAARRLKLRITQYSDSRAYGVGGSSTVMHAAVKQLKFGAVAMKDQQLKVLDSKIDCEPEDIDFILGQDFFSKLDSEFDLANDVIRLLQPEGCQPEQLVYWQKEYSLAELEPINAFDLLIKTIVLVNGQRVKAALDTGESISHISTQAARSSGVKMGINGASMEPLKGMGNTPILSEIGNFDTLTIGNETIRNAKIRISDLFGADRVERTGSHIAHPLEGLPEMLIGDDFFLSHRVVVLPHERKAFFTYNGGPVFQLHRPDEAAAAPALGEDGAPPPAGGH
jgi:hypothetical protein